MDNIIEQVRMQYRVFAESLGVSDAKDINDAVESGRMSKVISACNDWHEENIAAIAKMINDKIDTCKLVFISGPSSSGKTTFAKKLDEHLHNYHIDTITISMDDYYKPINEMPIGLDGKPDMEDIQAIDYGLLNEHLCALVERKTVYLPSYSFIDKKRDDQSRKVCLSANDIVVVEGIHGLNPLIASDISSNGKLKIYCSAICALNSGDDGHRISSETTRLIRRLCRDYYYRDADYIYTFDIWDKVEAGNVKNVFPFTQSADVFFNSSLPYEFCVMKKHVNEVLKSAEFNGKYKSKIDEIMNVVSQFIDVDDNMVPHNALLNEFIKR